MVSPKLPLFRALLLLVANGVALACLASGSTTKLGPPPPLPPELRKAPPQPPPHLPHPSEMTAQLKQLGDLLAMPAYKLAKLRDTIEFIEKMDPGERESMRIRISQITESTPELKSEIAGLTQRFPGISRSDLSQYWHAASSSEREFVRQELETRDPDQQLVFLDSRVAAFVEHRETLLQGMRKSLHKKREPAKTAP